MDEAALAFRFALGTIFFLSGLAKLSNLREFERVVRDYRVAPARLNRVIALTIPPVETLLGICLLLGFAIRTAGVAVAALLLLFSIAISINLIRGRRVSCGCFGTVSKKEISGLAVGRNLVFFGCAVAVSLWRPDVLSVVHGDNQSGSGLSATEGVAMLMTGSLAAFLLTMAQESTSVLKARRALEQRIVNPA